MAGEVWGSSFSQAPNVLEGKAPHTTHMLPGRPSQSDELGPAAPGIPWPTAGVRNHAICSTPSRSGALHPSPPPDSRPVSSRCRSAARRGTGVGVFPRTDSVDRKQQWVGRHICRVLLQSVKQTVGMGFGQFTMRFLPPVLQRLPSESRALHAGSALISGIPAMGCHRADKPGCMLPRAARLVQFVSCMR